MSDRDALVGFLHKWRERWPEWRVAEVFVAAEEREAAVAWSALLQELADAAWGGSDPRPGEAKLGWWAEELQGWAQGRRRHPLGQVLQQRQAPWTALASSLPALLESREPAADAAQARQGLVPFVDAVVAIEQALFAVAAAPADAAVAGIRTQAVLAQQLLLRGEAAAPLQVRARVAASPGEDAVAQAWTADLLAAWPVADAAASGRPVRILDALLRERLRRSTAGRPRSRPLPPLATLRLAWRAARG